MKTQMETCKHKWKIIENRIISYYKLFFKGKENWQIYTLQCSICGKLKHYRHSLGDEYEDIKSNE